MSGEGGVLVTVIPAHGGQRTDLAPPSHPGRPSAGLRNARGGARSSIVCPATGPSGPQGRHPDGAATGAGTERGPAPRVLVGLGMQVVEAWLRRGEKPRVAQGRATGP